MIPSLIFYKFACPTAIKNNSIKILFNIILPELKFRPDFKSILIDFEIFESLFHRMSA